MTILRDPVQYVRCNNLHTGKNGILSSTVCIRPTIDTTDTVCGINDDGTIPMRRRIRSDHHGHTGIMLAVQAPHGRKIDVDNHIGVQHDKRRPVQ